MSDFKAIFWDFDGVIIESNEVREKGFREVLKSFPKSVVDDLIVFHRKNGGLSRYVKFRFLYEELLGEKSNEEQVNSLAQKFSLIMKELLTDKSLLIQETTTFIRENYEALPMYIVSGSDEKELRFLCSKLGIASMFKEINGSPTPKGELVKQIINKFNLKANECVLIGDSINDFDAAKENGLEFFAYNNKPLEKCSTTNIKLH